jgi:hypothetical protein
VGKDEEALTTVSSRDRLARGSEGPVGRDIQVVDPATAVSDGEQVGFLKQCSVEGLSVVKDEVELIVC